MRDSIKEMEKDLKALANISRLKILDFLKKNKNSASVIEISEKTKCSYKATSKHLSILYRVNIVDREQKYYEMHYRIVATPSAPVRDFLKVL